MADIIQADFEQLAQIAKRFGQQADNTTQTLQSIARVLDRLKNGDWIGRGSTAFFAEMETEVLPAVNRLFEALTQAGSVTHDISNTIQQADEEASSPFRNNTAAQNPAAAGNNAVARFANLASAVYPATPQNGGASGAWQADTFRGLPSGQNRLASLVNDRGFTGSGTSPNGDGLGSGSSGINGAQNAYNVPNNWLAGVTGDGGGSLNDHLSSQYNDHGIPRDWLAGVTDAAGGNQSNELGVPRNWLAGVMDSFQQDLDTATASEAEGRSASSSDGGGSSGGSDSGGSSGGGSGSGAGGGEPPTTDSSPTTGSGAGGGASGGAQQGQVSDPYGRGNNFSRGYSQTTVSAAETEAAAPGLRYQSMGGGGAHESAPAVVIRSAGISTGGIQSAMAPAPGGNLGALSVGFAAVSPLLALAGKLLNDKFFENEN